jgi:hypothetical protein
MAEENISTYVDPLAGQETGRESSLSTWAGDYVTDMLGKGAALGSQDYQGYGGPLTAGTSELQDVSFGAFEGMDIPTDEMGVFTPQTFAADTAQQYMNPYLMVGLQPQLDEARRQAGITAAQNANKFAGAYGGSAQALFDAEATRNLAQNLSAITGQGYSDAFDKAMSQFNTEQGREMEAQTAANQYTRNLIGDIAAAGAEQRAIESEGITADRLQFEEERDFPYKQVQYMQSLLQGLPIGAQSYSYAEPSMLSEILGGAGGLQALYNLMYGKEDKKDGA